MQFHRWRRSDDPRTRECIVRGLLLSDCNVWALLNALEAVYPGWLRRQHYPTASGLMLSEPGLLPNGLPSLNPNPSRQEDEKGCPKFEFNYYSISWWSTQTWVRDHDIFKQVDVIAILFDRSKPITLQTAI
jgi:hypothetical protein